MAKLVKINSNKKTKRTLDIPLDEKKMKTAKLGYTFSVIGFVIVLYSLFASLSFLITVLYFIFLFVIIILTLLTILLSEKFRSLMAVGETINEVSNFLALTVVYTLPIGFVLSLLGFQLLISKKGYFHRTTGLIFSIISIVICVLILAAHVFIPLIIA